MDFGSLQIPAAMLDEWACKELELAWRNGGLPNIEDYLRDVSGPQRSARLRLLLAAEVVLRREIGEQPHVEEYLSRFPGDVDLVRCAFGNETPTITINPSPVKQPAAAPGAMIPAITGPLSVTGGSSGKWIWVWPTIAAAVLAIGGLWAHATIRHVMRAQLTSELLAVRDADVAALHLLFEAHQSLASIAANEPRVQAAVSKLVANHRRDPATLFRSPELAELRALLGPWLGRYEYTSFRILERQGYSIASWLDTTVGQPSGQEELECLETVFEGHATVSRPRPSEVPLADVDGNVRLGIPTMFVLAPIRGDDGQVIAALAFRMRPDRTFTRVLNVAQFGRSGETYAVDRKGLLLSESRFDDELKRIGLITDSPHSRSALSLELRDPGLDMTTGARPEERRATLPFAYLVARAFQAESGVDVDGGRDYRGVPVVGAWTWLPQYDFGVITKVDRAEAYRSLTILNTAFWSVFSLLGAAAVAMLIFTVIVARLRGRVHAAAQVVKRLGQYTLDGKIGEGGMGVVYRASHAMLRRPTAVKLLRPERTDDRSIARFEREVQLTSRLTHPNTITIYDYGRTSDGIFYYAMEYLDGIDLQALVIRYGPQPEGRVIHLLKQVCGSLVEAHGIGLIHRDIKPSNIILTRRGGLFDFVKLVDFGLVKAVDPRDVGIVTAVDAVMGTPNYLAPEAIRLPDQADARTDLYGVGAVGYFLLAGRPLFACGNVAEILIQQLRAKPEPPSVHRGSAVAPELESLLLSCLATNPADRPESAQVLADALERISASTWSMSEAASWWRAHDDGNLTRASSSPAPAQASGVTVVLPNLTSM
jgi:tRNA A-37 threonylcarbamoyl transferase component Bud32